MLRVHQRVAEAIFETDRRRVEHGERQRHDRVCAIDGAPHVYDGKRRPVAQPGGTTPRSSSSASLLAAFVSV